MQCSAVQPSVAGKRSALFSLFAVVQSTHAQLFLLPLPVPATNTDPLLLRESQERDKKRKEKGSKNFGGRGGSAVGVADWVDLEIISHFKGESGI